MPLPHTRGTLHFAALFLVTAAAAAVRASDHTSAPQPTVEIFMPPLLDRTVNQTLAPAREIVRAAYAEIGVRVLWRSGNPRRSSDCGKAPGHRQILLAFEAGERRPQRGADALAFAKPYANDGPCVVLLLDRLEEEAKRNPAATAILLGHVLAHEIGHVLQGIERHSETGIMKARWTTQDRTEMRATRLSFTEHDASLIHDSFRNNHPTPRQPPAALDDGDR